MRQCGIWSVEQFLIGVDEAEVRMGPMVIASIAIPEKDVQILRDLKLQF